MKLLALCESCKKRRFIVKKRKLVIPTGHTATSKILMCGSCMKKLNKLFTV